MSDMRTIISRYRSSIRFQFIANGYTERELDSDGDFIWYFDDAFVRA